MNKGARAAWWMLAGVVLLAASAQAGGPKLTAEELLAKHLDAVASAEARAAAKSRAAEWNARYFVRMGGVGSADGKAVFVSEGRKLGLGMKFPVSEYPGERFVFDGQKYDTAMIVLGQRSPLGDLLLQESEVLREGLVGGALSTAWPLLDLKERKAKLKYDGLKKVDGVQLHRLTYEVQKITNGLKIMIFLDPVTFRHVKTIYLLEIQPGAPQSPGGIGGASNAGSAGRLVSPNTRYTLEEDFSEFKTFDGFTLPTRWQIRYTWEPTSGQGITVIEWTLALARLINNAEVNPKDFTLQ